jgi:hypothetical protein
VPLAIAGSYMKALSRCERRWLPRSNASRPSASGARESRRVPRQMLRRIELTLSPPFGSEPQGRRRPSFTARLVRPPTWNPNVANKRGRTSGGRIGRLRSSMCSKLSLTGRRRRQLCSRSVAKGLQELQQASQHRPHRKQLFVYEPTNPSGTKSATDKNPALKNPSLKNPRLTALTLRTQKNG